jgi:hypothetical protein
MRALVLLILCVSCAGTDKRCETALDKLTELDERNGLEIIESGACDDHEVVTDCPAYQKHRMYFDSIAASLEVCK